jgi:FkbM family methyltransferase
VIVHGNYMYWFPEAYEAAIIYSLEDCDSETRFLLESLLNPGMTFIDLGANIGFYSLAAAKKIQRNGKVYAFEPQPLCCKVLRQSVHANGYDGLVDVIEKGVSNKTTTCALHLKYPGDGGASLYVNPQEGIKPFLVETVTLDDFFENKGWPTVDLIKMDIEGAEQAALEGMKQLVGRNPDLKLIIEFSPVILSASNVSNEQLFETLREFDFIKVSVIEGGLQAVDLPQDIPHLVQMAGDGCVNLLCERV